MQSYSSIKGECANLCIVVKADVTRLVFMRYQHCVRYIYVSLGNYNYNYSYMVSYFQPYIFIH